MASVTSRFDMKIEDIERLQRSIMAIGNGAEKIINQHVHTVTAEQIVEGATRFIPVSKKGKRHAKRNKWWEQKNYNLATAIETSQKGRRGTSFYYLYYVVTGTGTSYEKGKRDFMSKGLETKYDEIVETLFEELDEYIERGLE